MTAQDKTECGWFGGLDISDLFNAYYGDDEDLVQLAEPFFRDLILAPVAKVTFYGEDYNIINVVGTSTAIIYQIDGDCRVLFPKPNVKADI